MKKKILVTGGAGFIGKHLCEKLLTNKNHVYCLDNLYSSSLSNISSFFSKKNFEFINHDIEKKIDLKIDEIFHLACPASPVNYKLDPIKTIKTNIIGSINVLELASKYNAKIFHSSTSEVYGNPTITPQSEDYFGNVNIIGPRSCYDEGKRCAETLFFDYHRSKKIKIKVARIFKTYGPFMQKNDGRVISNFIVQALNNKNITIYGDGKQTRSFCYIDDLINGILKLMNTSKKTTGPINLGNPQEMKIIDIAKKIIKLTDSKSKIKFFPLTEDDPLQRKPDITKAKKIIKFKPSININEGLTRTIKYFRNQ